MKTSTEGINFDGDLGRYAGKSIRRILQVGYKRFLKEEHDNPSWPDEQWGRFIEREIIRIGPENLPFDNPPDDDDIPF